MESLSIDDEIVICDFKESKILLNREKYLSKINFLKAIIKSLKIKAARRLVRSEGLFLHTAHEERILRILNERWGSLLSFRIRESVNNDGDPLPWFTYPAIEFINQFNLRAKNVFEWGMGNSTLYFSQRCKFIDSIEHDDGWYKKMNKALPENAKGQLVDNATYAEFPLSLKKQFDIIVVDGILRRECLQVAPSILAPGGLIIFDNSDRNPDLCELLRNQNFIEIDFHGFGPVNDYTWTTSLFFSSDFNFTPGSVQPLIPKGGGF